MEANHMTQGILNTIISSIFDLFPTSLNAKFPDYVYKFISKNPGSRRFRKEILRNIPLKFLYLIFFKHLEFLTNLKKEQNEIFTFLPNTYFKNLFSWLNSYGLSANPNSGFNEIQRLLTEVYQNISNVNLKSIN